MRYKMKIGEHLDKSIIKIVEQNVTLKKIWIIN